MDNLVGQGVIGIITGILTTVILYIAKTFWTAKVTPFLTSIRYQGVKVDGLWSGSHHNDDPTNGEIYSSECTLFLEQNAHELGGTFLFKLKSESKDFILDFVVKGYMWEGYITLNFTPKDKRITSYATSLLKLHDGGLNLVGTWLFRNVEQEFVDQGPIILSRNIKNS